MEKTVPLNIRIEVLKLVHASELMFCQKNNESANKVIETLSVALGTKPNLSVEQVIGLHREVLLQEVIGRSMKDNEHNLWCILKVLKEIKDWPVIKNYLLTLPQDLPEYMRREALRSNTLERPSDEEVYSKVNELRKTIKRFLGQ